MKNRLCLYYASAELVPTAIIPLSTYDGHLKPLRLFPTDITRVSTSRRTCSPFLSRVESSSLIGSIGPNQFLPIQWSDFLHFPCLSLSLTHRRPREESPQSFECPLPPIEETFPYWARVIGHHSSESNTSIGNAWSARSNTLGIVFGLDIWTFATLLMRNSRVFQLSSIILSFGLWGKWD